jgi:hypothetical protein
MASVATNSSEDPKKGNRIMIAGLAFQVATMLLFLILAADFAWRMYTRQGVLQVTALEHQRAQLRRSWPFRACIAALTLSTLLIFTRCVFRVAELSEGWEGHLANTQKYFTGLESAIIVAAVLLLTRGLCSQARRRGMEKAIGAWWRTMVWRRVIPNWSVSEQRNEGSE